MYFGNVIKSAVNGDIDNISNLGGQQDTVFSVSPFSLSSNVPEKKPHFLKYFTYFSTKLLMMLSME
jgi:hypothetical protein